MITAADITDFWLDEVGPQGWYMPPEGLDDQIRDRYAAHTETALEGGYDAWCHTPEGTLAVLILLDQFPRNMYRDTARAFAYDERARAICKWAIWRGQDLRIVGPARQFFYMPLMHSESLQDQQRAVRLFMMRGDDGNLKHARAHRDQIRMFGRFATRNTAMERMSTQAEQAFLDAGGYGALYNALD